MLHDRAGQLITAQVALLILALIFVGLRCYVRLTMKFFGIDDGLMVLGLVFFVLMTVANVNGAQNGLGVHAVNLTPAEMVQGAKWWFYWEVFYIFGALPIKLSILWTLHRISVQRRYHFSIYGAMVITVLTSLILVFYIIGYCTPMPFHWDKSIKNGQCGSEQNVVNLGYAVSAVTIVTDWFCAIVPIFLLWNVQMNWIRKASVAFVLSLGVLASIATIVRLKSVINLTSTTDFLYGLADVVLWSTIECGIGITAGSIATLRPLFRVLRNESSLNRGNYDASHTLPSTHSRHGFGTTSSRSRYIKPEDSVELGKLDKDGTNMKTYISSETKEDLRGSDSSWADHESQRGIVQHSGGIEVTRDLEITVDRIP